MKKLDKTNITLFQQGYENVENKSHLWTSQCSDFLKFPPKKIYLDY